MNFYYIEDRQGFLQQVGQYNHPAELLYFFKKFGARVHKGKPEGYDGGTPPTDGARWHIASRQWQSREPDAALAWDEAKYHRGLLLAATDWVVLRAQDQGTAVPAEWQAYRQALRDITAQPDPFNIQWPVQP